MYQVKKFNNAYCKFKMGARGVGYGSRYSLHGKSDCFPEHRKYGCRQSKFVATFLNDSIGSVYNIISANLAAQFPQIIK